MISNEEINERRRQFYLKKFKKISHFHPIPILIALTLNLIQFLKKSNRILCNYLIFIIQ